MLTKFQIIIVSAIIFIQIFFSIYYSQTIIKLSQNHNQLEKNINLLQSQKQKLLNKLTETTSLSRLKQSTNNLSPITKTINLEP